MSDSSGSWLSGRYPTSRKSFKSPSKPIFVSALVVACTLSSARAETASWSGGAVSTDNWSDANNWLLWDRPGGGDDVEFSGTPARTSPYVNEDYNVGILFFAEASVVGTTSSFTINGNSTLKVSNVYNQTDRSQRINAHLQFRSDGKLTNNRNGGDYGWMGVNTVDTNGMEVTVEPSDDGIDIHGTISGSGSVVVNGPGYLTLTGNNSFYGGLAIAQGTVNYGGGPNLGGTDNTIFFIGSSGSNAALRRYVSGTTVSPVHFQSGEGSIAIPAGVTVTYSGSFTGSGDLGKAEAGTLILTNLGPQRSGRTFVREGVLQLGAGVKLPDTSLHVFSGATLTYLTATNDTIGNLYGGGTVNLGTDSTWSIGSVGGINGNGEFSGSINALNTTLYKRGTGTLSLTGNSTLTGTVNVVVGTMLYNNIASSTSAIGTANTFVQSGSTLGGDGATDGPIEVKAGGTLEPSPGEGASLTGTFGTITGMMMTNGKRLAVTYDAKNVYVTAALPGDTNLDDAVTFADLLTLAQQYDKFGTQTWSNGDFDGNGSVAFSDLLALAQYYGLSALSEEEIGSLGTDFASDWALAQSIVPEPTSLLSLGILCTVMRRSRR